MMHILALFIIIFKGSFYFLSTQLICYFTIKNILAVIALLLLKMILRKIYKYKYRYNNLTTHILAYRFKSKTEFYVSSAIILSTILSFIILILYLRIMRLSNPLDLNIVAQHVYDFYQRANILLCMYNIMIIYLFLKTLFLFMKVVRKKLNIHVTKMHLFLLCFSRYISIHTYIRDHISLDARIIYPLQEVIVDMQSILCFGYKKELHTKDDEEGEVDITNKKLFWTSKDRQQYDIFLKKYSYIFTFLHRLVKVFFYNLHILLFSGLFIFDIIQNDFVLKYLSITLPWIFLYQLYVVLSSFIQDKITYNAFQVINTYYYKDVTIVGDHSVLFNGELYALDTNFIQDFLEYEAVDFYYSLYLKRKEKK